MKYNISGNAKSLLGMHGDVSCDKAIEALITMSEIDLLDVDKVNKYSEQGMLYVTSSGKILNDCSETSERLAKYKIIPTGLKLRYTNYPLFASFIKLKNFWEGAFIGTGIQLFEMYKSHYKNDDFNDAYKEIFGGENQKTDILGFGLTDVMVNKTKEIETTYADPDTTSASSELALAIERMQKKDATEGSKKKSNKNMRKALRLQAHLDKMKEKEIKKEKEAKARELRAADNSKKEKNEIIWLNILPLEESQFTFEDAVTAELKQKIHDYINGDARYSEYDTDIEEYSIEKIEDITELAREKYSEINTADTVILEMDHDNHNDAYYAKEKFKTTMKIALIHDIYDRLLIKEHWMISENRNRLGFYLKGLCIFVWDAQKQNPDIIRGNGYTYSEDKSKCVINTGLLDKYGNYVYIIDHTPLFPDFFDKKISIMNTKANLLEFGFRLQDIRNLPKPIRFVDNMSDFIFSANIEDFDLDDDFHLKHIVRERRERFPKKYRNEPDWVLCDKLKSAVVQAVNISKVDYRYVLPKYDFSRKQIQFVIPFYLCNTYDMCPELTIIVGEQNGLWNIFTVLKPHDAYDDTRLICKPNDSWLDIYKNGGK